MSIGRVAKWFTCWILLLGLYLLFTGSLQTAEVAAGAIFALVAGLLAAVLGRAFNRPLKAKPVWFPVLLRIPWAMLEETWLLGIALFRRLTGRETAGTFIDHRSFAPEDENDPARRAFMTFGVCITPNSYLVRYDRNTRTALVRQLVGRRISTIDRKFVELP